ncbi:MULTISPECIES: aminodeoxychorismate lyase [Aeromonas]|uniref:aminodeoxychorismate lyase n=1 Tax=Aeromonas TaxID=642 RepID=UPI00191F1FF3|nr:aminodeoxychorismate lyase [Aeromonas caviae]MBL0530104.1 aminodeoxychorismate lyase [Aeromonas caviae]MBL0547772.1 aminodeoxychorismate lyase [Aeromonas caviae]MDX7676895.1 aminodeoxychorismate lyase [Aeromonas caviae]
MLINGIPTETLSARDRGLAYGDGHFTTMLVREGKVLWWQDHLARLQHANARLGFGEHSWDLLADEAAQLASGQTQAVVKIMLTRGAGGRGYDGAGCDTPTRIVSLAPYPEHYHDWQQTGINALVCQQQLGDSPMLAGLKTLGRLEQVMLKRELAARGGVEGIVLNSRGFLVEGVSANLFWRRGRTVFTPDLTRAGIDGIMRKRVMTMLKQMGIELRVVEAPLESLWQAEEVWLTNTLVGIVPVTSIGDMHYPSPVLIRRLQERLVIEV